MIFRQGSMEEGYFPLAVPAITQRMSAKDAKTSSSTLSAGLEKRKAEAARLALIAKGSDLV
jgi:hypothetical protein